MIYWTGPDYDKEYWTLPKKSILIQYHKGLNVSSQYVVFGDRAYFHCITVQTQIEEIFFRFRHIIFHINFRLYQDTFIYIYCIFKEDHRISNHWLLYVKEITTGFTELFKRIKRENYLGSLANSSSQIDCRRRRDLKDCNQPLWGHSPIRIISKCKGCICKVLRIFLNHLPNLLEKATGPPKDIPALHRCADESKIGRWKSM